jgi:hypothetical protein
LGHLVYFVIIWYIFPVLVYCTKKNLATLLNMHCMFVEGQKYSHLADIYFFKLTPRIEFCKF